MSDKRLHEEQSHDTFMRSCVVLCVAGVAFVWLGKWLSSMGSTWLAIIGVLIFVLGGLAVGAALILMMHDN